jgi:oligopeptide/dipeptide ABC transporter ATP-binding protein
VTCGSSLDVRDLTLTSRGPDLVRGASLSVSPGEILGILGESGSGKTTLCRAIAGVLPDGLEISRGTIVGGGRADAATARGGAKRGRKGVGMVFQEPLTALNPVMRIGDQIAEAFRSREDGSGRRDARAATVELLEWVGLPDAQRRLASFPHEFSGGQRQRILLAVVLAANPAVLLADEPTSSLDVRTQIQILELLRKVVAERQIAMVIVTHDFGVIRELCSHVAVMYGGALVEVGTMTEVLHSPRHPYSLALMQAIPSLSGERVRLQGIPGAPVNPGDLVPGCRFSPRCRHAKPFCQETVPPLRPIAPEHASACLRVEQKRGLPAEVVREAE